MPSTAEMAIWLMMLYKIWSILIWSLQVKIHFHQSSFIINYIFWNIYHEIFLLLAIFIFIIHIRYTFFIIYYFIIQFLWIVCCFINFIIDIVRDILIGKFKKITKIKRDNLLNIEIANNFLIKNYINKNYLK